MSNSLEDAQKLQEAWNSTKCTLPEFLEMVLNMILPEYGENRPKTYDEKHRKVEVLTTRGHFFGVIWFVKNADVTNRTNELARLKRYDEELSAVMPKDFKDWWENSPEEWPIVARGVIESLREREDLAWQQVEFAHEELESRG